MMDGWLHSYPHLPDCTTALRYCCCFIDHTPLFLFHDRARSINECMCGLFPSQCHRSQISPHRRRGDEGCLNGVRLPVNVALDGNTL
jgi:hypothetical protein